MNESDYYCHNRDYPAGDEVLLITLADPDRWELPFFAAGAHIDLYLENGLRRAYSLCGDPHDRYHYQVAVKLAKEGRGGSRWIHTHFQPGKSVGVSLPRATMTLQQGMAKHVLIAGGIGITPMLSFVYVLEKQRQDYELHYFYRGAAPLLKQVKQAIRGGSLYLYPGDSVAQKKKRLADIVPPWRAEAVK
ncbi:ferredoxin reductase [Sodalis praecaptivus]|uniref:ferredoxin reductase n=1 Tax=Sodalis praecaptivus TaxID=1239307 RepID=UPI00280B3C7B|nr:ferredoxin reductase [Sodalis praecaptivus]